MIIEKSSYLCSTKLNYMKKLTILIALASLVLASCSKSKQDILTSNEWIPTKWIHNKIDAAKSCPTAQPTIFKNDTCFMNQPCANKTYNYLYTIPNDTTIILTYIPTKGSNTYSYKIDEKSLLLSNKYDTIQFIAK